MRDDGGEQPRETKQCFMSNSVSYHVLFITALSKSTKIIKIQASLDDLLEHSLFIHSGVYVEAALECI